MRHRGSRRRSRARSSGRGPLAFRRFGSAAGRAGTWTAIPRSPRTRWFARSDCTARPRCGCSGAGGQARRAVLPIGAAAVRLARARRLARVRRRGNARCGRPAGPTTSRSRFGASCRSCRRGSTARCADCRTVTVSPAARARSRAAPGVVELAAGRGWGAREAGVPGADVRIPSRGARRPAVGARFALGDRAARGRLCRRARGRADRPAHRSSRRRRRGRLRTCSRRSPLACASTARRRSAA